MSAGSSPATSAEKIDLFKELRKTEYAQPKAPTLIEIGEGSYLSIEGAGEPGGDEFAAKVGGLYAIAYTIKMTRKLNGGQDYVIGKLEGCWWSDQGPDLKNVPKDQWRWMLLIRTPEVVSQEELQRAAATLEKKGKTPAAGEVRLERITEGPCIQMLHVGPFEQEWRTISQMLDHARDLGYEPHGNHHEIYLSDPRRMPPERMKTILRLPVSRSKG